MKLSKELREAYRSEMINFKFLTEPAEPYSYVAESSFADGTKVIANMTDKDYQYKNNNIKAHSFIINKEAK